jgi:1,6-anhydro-N-acetylmuramate kinase
MKTGKTMAFGVIAALLVAGMAVVLVSGGVSALSNGATSVGNGDLDQVRGQVQSATCDQDQVKAQDGSCQDVTCDQDQARDQTRSCW